MKKLCVEILLSNKKIHKTQTHLYSMFKQPCDVLVVFINYINTQFAGREHYYKANTMPHGSTQVWGPGL